MLSRRAHRLWLRLQYPFSLMSNCGDQGFPKVWKHPRAQCSSHHLVITGLIRFQSTEMSFRFDAHNRSVSAHRSKEPRMSRKNLRHWFRSKNVDPPGSWDHEATGHASLDNIAGWTCRRQTSQKVRLYNSTSTRDQNSPRNGGELLSESSHNGLSSSWWWIMAERWSMIDDHWWISDWWTVRSPSEKCLEAGSSGIEWSCQIEPIRRRAILIKLIVNLPRSTRLYYHWALPSTFEHARS